MREKSVDLSPREIFRILRHSMGHTWPEGTFSKAKDPGIIEGEFRVVEPKKNPVPRPRRLSKGK